MDLEAEDEVAIEAAAEVVEEGAAVEVAAEDSILGGLIRIPSRLTSATATRPPSSTRKMDLNFLLTFKAQLSTRRCRSWNT